MCAALEMSHFWINVIYCASWKIFTKEGIFLLFFYLDFIQHLQIACTVNTNSFVMEGKSQPLIKSWFKTTYKREGWTSGHMSGQTVYSHCFLSKLILVISNTAILQRLDSGRQQTDYFLVEILSAVMTVSSYPTSFVVASVWLCTLSKVTVWPRVDQKVVIISGGLSGWWYYLAEAEIRFITYSLRCKVVLSTR